MLEQQASRASKEVEMVHSLSHLWTVLENRTSCRNLTRADSVDRKTLRSVACLHVADLMDLDKEESEER